MKILSNELLKQKQEYICQQLYYWLRVEKEDSIEVLGRYIMAFAKGLLQAQAELTRDEIFHQEINVNKITQNQE